MLKTEDLNDYKEGKDKNNFYICCPFCIKNRGKEDFDYKMGVSLDKGIYHCFKCEESGIVDGRFREGLEYTKVHDEHANLIDALRNKLHERIHSDHSLKGIDLDLFSKPISKKTPMSLEYIYSRGLTLDDVGFYNIRSGISYEIDGRVISSWSGRVIFPVTIGEKTIYAVGRSYTGQEQKYYNTNKDKKSLLYGSERLVEGAVAVCEGIISSIFCTKHTGMQSVAVLGKSITESQVEILVSKGINSVYLCLDGSVSPLEKKKNAEKILKYFKEVKIVNLPVSPKGDDPADLGKEEVNEAFSKAVNVNKLTIRRYGAKSN